MHRSLRFIPLLLAVLVLANCGSRHGLNLRVSVHLKSGGEWFVFSENYSIDVSIGSPIFRALEGSGHRAKMQGEAIVVQNGQKVVLATYSLLGGTPNGTLRAAHKWRYDNAVARKTWEDRPNYANWYRLAPTLTMQATVPREAWPKFFGFEDLDDPTTAYEIAPEDLPWGKIARVTVQATSQKHDIGDVAHVLPWFDQIPSGSICWEPYNPYKSEAEEKPCRSIYKENFVKTRDSDQ